MSKDCTATGCVLSLLIHMGGEQGQVQELGDKGTRSGTAGYRKKEVRTPLSLPIS